ncbi:MAG: glycosyltransferase family protein, partial [Alphaproteobacteria bacterium]|nr:glycosyltransferase family protein [Alphaproteobacteria bacterium]
MSHTVALVQARMSSTRLPGKVLLEIAGVPALLLVIERVRRARHVDEVVVLTSDDPSDDALAAFCADRGVRCHRGSLDDVLDRYRSAVEVLRPTTVVRITGDCPLLDPNVLDLVIERYRQHSPGVRYATNCSPPTFPDGLDCEVMDAEALLEAARTATLRFDREHVTPYVRKHFPKVNYGLVDEDW